MKDFIPLLFDATNGKSAIYTRMLASGRFEAGRLVRKVYGDREIGHFIQPDLNPQGAHPSLKGTLTGRKVVIVGDLSTHELAMDTYDVCNNAFDEIARELTLVVPKSSLPKDKFRREAMLDLFAAIPKAPSGNHLVLVDDNYASAGEGLVATPEYSTVRRRKRSTRSAYDQFGNDAKPVLLFTHAYQYLAHEMAELGDFELGMYETETLDDGHIFFKKLTTDVRGRRVIIVSGTIDARETFEQYYMARAVAEQGALSRDIIEAYFAYGTMERKTKSGEAVKAKIRARMLSSLPPCAFGNRVIFVDLHADGIPYYLEGGVQHHHSYVGKHLVAVVAREMGGIEAPYFLGQVELAVPPETAPRPVLAATDNGRSKWVKSMGDDTRLATAFGRKERIGDDEVVFVGAHGDVNGKNTLVYDDKCGTGGTAIKASAGIRIDQYGGADVVEKAKECGVCESELPPVETVIAFSHFVGTPEVVQKLRDAKDALGRTLFTKVVASNSHPVAYELAHQPDTAGFFTVKSIAPLLCKAVAE